MAERPAGAGPRRRFPRPPALPLLVFTAAVVVLMPLALLGLRTYAAVDLGEAGSPYRDAGTAPLVHVPLQLDQVEGLPGPATFWNDLRHGHLDLWDPTLAGGSPFGTVPFNGVLSPFSLTYLVLPAAYAVGLLVALELLFCMWTTYALLRRLGAGTPASTLAGLAYALNGTNLVFIHRADGVFLLPAMLLAAHAVVDRPTPRRAALLALPVAAAWFAGFPAVFVYCVDVTAAWAAWLIVRRLVAARGAGWAAAVRAAVRPLLAVGGGFAAGAALAAVTLLPFTAFLNASGVLAGRTYTLPLPSLQVFGLLDADATGPPLTGPYWAGLNAVESVSLVGTVALAAACGGLLAAAAGRLRLSAAGAEAWPFFAVLAVVGIVLSYVGTPLLTLAYHVPGIGSSPINRTRFVIALGTAVCGALAVDSLWRGGGAVRAARLLSGLAVVGIVAPFVWQFQEFHRAAIAAAAWHGLVDHLALDAFIAGVALLAALAGRRWPGALPLAALGISAALVYQLEFPLRAFTPEAPVRDFYSTTDGHRTLEALLDGRYRFAGTQFTYMNNSASVFGTADLRGLTIHPPAFRSLVEAALPTAFARDSFKVIVARDDWHMASPVLDDLALRYVVLSTDEQPFGRLVDEGDRVEQKVVADAAPSAARRSPGTLSGALVSLDRTGACEGGRLTVSVVDSAGRTVAQTTLSTAAISPGWVPVGLTAQAVHGGDTYSVRLRTAGLPGGCTIVAGVTGGDSPHLALRPIVEDGSPAHLAATVQGWFYERPGAWPLVSAHTRWRTFPDQASLLAWLSTRPPADSDVAAYVGSGPGSDAGGGSATVDTFHLAGTGIDATVTATSDALLVVSQNGGDGWSATVDGASTPVLPVDGALMGVMVPPGHHLVHLRYLPRSLVEGAALSGAAGVAVVVALAGVPAPWRRRLSAAASAWRRRGGSPHR